MCIYSYSLDSKEIPSIRALHIHHVPSKSSSRCVEDEDHHWSRSNTPHKISLRDYKQLWHHGSIRKRIWALYKNDKTEYIAAYRGIHPDFFNEQEYGMKVFRSCERRIMNQRWDSAGQAALLKSVDMLKNSTLLSWKDGTLDSELTNLPVSISMDVEDNNWDRQQGMRELGIATLGLRESCKEKYCRPTIHSTNYILNSSASRRKFLLTPPRNE